MVDNKILKGVVKGLGQLGMETMEKAGQEGQKIIESVITGKELLGLERTMSDSKLKQSIQEEKIRSQQEINKLKGEMCGKKEGENGEKKVKERPRNVEDELTQLRRQKEREEEEKVKYFEKQKQQKEMAEQRQTEEYNYLNEESSNPSKQKKSRGSAFVNKKKHKPDTDQTSATQEFNKGGKID